MSLGLAPFPDSILLVGVGLYIRLSLAETPVFRQINLKDEVAAIPIMEILGRHRRPFFIAIRLKISEIAYFSVASVFAISYVTGHLGLPRSLILNAVLMSSAVALVSIPTFGWLADMLGRKTMFIASRITVSQRYELGPPSVEGQPDCQRSRLIMPPSFCAYACIRS